MVHWWHQTIPWCDVVVEVGDRGGYGDGVALKRVLLDLEGGVTAPPDPAGQAGRPRSARESHRRYAYSSLAQSNR